MFCFDGSLRGNYFGGEPIGGAEVEEGVERPQARMAGEMIKGEDDRVEDWI